MTVYVRIRDHKFWIEEDRTEDDIANDLVQAGVPHEDIVLAACRSETPEALSSKQLPCKPLIAVIQ
jgi:XisI protein